MILYLLYVLCLTRTNRTVRSPPGNSAIHIRFQFDVFLQRHTNRLYVLIELDAGSFQFDYRYIVVQFNTSFKVLMIVNFIDVNILFRVFVNLNRTQVYVNLKTIQSAAIILVSIVNSMVGTLYTLILKRWNKSYNHMSKQLFAGLA